MAWPERKPTRDAVEKMTAGTTGLDLYHSTMSAIGYGTKSKEGAAVGLRIFSVVAEMSGNEAGDEPIPRFRRYRASFRAMAGDIEGALDDLEWEKARQSKDDPDVEYLQREIDELRGRRVTKA